MQPPGADNTFHFLREVGNIGGWGEGEALDLQHHSMMCSFVDFHIPSRKKISGARVDCAGIVILLLQQRISN